MEIANTDISKILASNRWLWHVGFWLLYTISRGVQYYYTILYYDHKFLEFMLLVEASFVILVYATLWLYKYLIARKRISLYFFIGLIIWILHQYLRICFQKYYLKSIPFIAKADISDLFIDVITSHLITFFILTMLKYLKDVFIEQYNESERKKFQIESELKNLKSQISPHFLFNTMNNFYGLAVEKSNTLPALMIRLSDLLRYSLYETNQEKVLLDNEIRYLQNYIELEKIRLEENLNVSFIIHKGNTDTCQIAPLILIPFVENCFKHAKNSDNENILILIELAVSSDCLLTFKTKNNFNKNTDKNIDTVKGIGLENVKKRLGVLYPNNKYKMTNYIDENYYYSELSIYLK